MSGLWNNMKTTILMGSLMGLCLGWLRVRSGSLYPCIAMHFTHNLLAILAEMGGH